MQARLGAVQHFTFLYNVGTAFLLHMRFVAEPLDAFSKCVHVRILEYIDDHDDLVVSRCRVMHVVARRTVSLQQMCDGLTCQHDIAIRKMCNPGYVVGAINVFANLVVVCDRTLDGWSERTFAMVRSQFCSTMLSNLMRATGTIQSLTGGGFG